MLNAMNALDMVRYRRNIIIVVVFCSLRR